MSAKRLSSAPISSPVIHFEDQHLIVLSKPAGLLSQSAEAGDENLVDWLRQYVGRNYIGLIHRLDRNTSGLMVVAKRSKSATRLSEALRSGSLQRGYCAWLAGDLPEDQHWVDSLLKDNDENLVSIVPENTPGARRAELRAYPLERWQGPHKSARTLARFQLETGRAHQIRVQAASRNLPILGDTKYGSVCSEINRPALHSNTLNFPHPMSKEQMEFSDPLPVDLQNLQPSARPGWRRL